MTTLPDQKKQRREYLKQMGTAYARIMNGLLLFVFAALMVYGCYLMLFVYTIPKRAERSHSRSWQDVAMDCDNLRPRPSVIQGGVILLAFSAAYPGVLVLRGARLIKQARQEIRLHYVPPVTADNLPAEEILVRGAEEPSTPAETLLRATTSNEETPGGQLLRAETWREPGG